MKAQRLGGDWGRIGKREEREGDFVPKIIILEPPLQSSIEAFEERKLFSYNFTALYWINFSLYASL